MPVSNLSPFQRPQVLTHPPITITRRAGRAQDDHFRNKLKHHPRMRTEITPNGQVITTILILPLPDPGLPVESAAAPPAKTADANTHIVDVFADSGSSFHLSQVSDVQFNLPKGNRKITQSSLEMLLTASAQERSAPNVLARSMSLVL